MAHKSGVYYSETEEFFEEKPNPFFVDESYYAPHPLNEIPDPPEIVKAQKIILWVSIIVTALLFIGLVLLTRAILLTL